MKARAILKLLISRDYILVVRDEAFLSNEHKLINQISMVLDKVETE